MCFFCYEDAMRARLGKVDAPAAIHSVTPWHRDEVTYFGEFRANVDFRILQRTIALPGASDCSFQFLEVSECAFLMPVGHQS
jgi:hypothetical protein